MTATATTTSDRVVVIGSGPCGAMAARELSTAGVPVTMLEAGTRPPTRADRARRRPDLVAPAASQAAMITDRHVAAGDPATEWYSSLEPGGLSNYWTAAVPRFAPEDFTDGGRLDERFVWPVSYDELVPFYEVAEELLCITGPTRLAAGAPRRSTCATAQRAPDRLGGAGRRRCADVRHGAAARRSGGGG